jgi:hypothetical protein
MRTRLPINQFRPSGSSGGGAGALAAAAAAAAAAAGALGPAAAPGLGGAPEWLPSGPFNVGSFGRGSLGLSPHAVLAGTPPFGRSVDMVDVCAQLMEAGGAGRRGRGRPCVLSRTM